MSATTIDKDPIVLRSTGGVYREIIRIGNGNWTLNNDVLAKSYAHTTDVKESTFGCSNITKELTSLIRSKLTLPGGLFPHVGFWFLSVRLVFYPDGLPWVFQSWQLVLVFGSHKFGGECHREWLLPVSQYRYDSHSSCSHVSSSNHGENPWLILSHKMTSHVGAPSSPLGIAHFFSS